MSATVNGHDAIRLEMRRIRTGAWHIDADLDGEVKITNPVMIVVDDVTIIGAVNTQDASGGRTKAWIVGGKGNLEKKLEPQHYDSPQASTVIRDILAMAGETLDPSSQIPPVSMRHWQRMEGKASHALVSICDKTGASWRTTNTGTIWVGEETWPTVSAKVETIEDWTSGSIELAAHSFSELVKVLPGTVLDGHKLDQVTLTVTPESIRGVATTTSVETAAKGFLGAVRSLMLFSGIYRCTVVAQNADGTLQLQPDDERIAGAGLDKVPIRYGMPGWKATVGKGAVVRVGFDGGDPSQPWAGLWEDGNDASVTCLEYKPSGRGSPMVVVGDTGEGQIPMGVPISGLLSGAPFSGIVTIATPVTIVFSGPGNPKLKA